MNLLHLIQPLYAASGFAVGMLVGLTGVGGGSLMTPLLVMVFGVHATTAVGTDLLYAAATKSVGTTVHGFKGSIDWSVVGRLAAGSVPATTLTLLAMAHLPASADYGHALITRVLGVALLLTAAAILFRRRLQNYFAAHVRPLSERETTAYTVLLGAVLGVLVSLSSVGAGAIGVTVLLLLYPKMPTGKLVGSDIAHAVPLTLIAGLGHWMMGSVDWRLLVSLLTGSIPGIVVGSLFAARTPDTVLRRILGGTLFLVAIKLFF